MSIYHLDFETYSPQPLVGPKGVDAFRYAVDPETEILIMAIAKDNGPVRVWKHGDYLDSDAPMMLMDAIETGALIYAHNAQFEHAICHYLLTKTFGIRPPKANQWRCTAAMARLAAIPSSLEECAAFLDLNVQKDKEGKRLIGKFSTPHRPSRKDPRTRVMPGDDPEDFDKFVKYCIWDVKVEREIHKRLEKDFPLKGWALDSFTLDMEMNTAGIPVNRPALEHASKLMDEYLDRLVPVFRSQVAEEGGTCTLPVTKQRKQPKKVDITEGFNPSQGELFKVWLAGEGFTGGNLQADTQEDWLENWEEYGLTKRGRAALHTYSLVASAAVKKIPTMLRLACPDGMVRGGLHVFGAERTHRWAGRGIQPQNFARPKIKFTEFAYEMLCSKATLNEIEDMCGDFFDVLVSVLRHFIQPHNGAMVLQADYSAIEARVAPWLVGEQKKLDLFAKGEPIYEIMAQRIFGGRVEDITQDQRFIGKQAELGCLGEGTKVLTQGGWKNVEKIETADKVWDGIEWVDHKGLIFQGIKETLNGSGLWLTPDHKILCGHQWLEAQVVQRENTLSQALEIAAVNLPSQAMSWESVVAAKPLSSDAVVTNLNTVLPPTISESSDLPVVLSVQPTVGQKISRTIGSILRSFQTMQHEHGYSTGSLLKFHGATTQKIPSIKTMVPEGSQFVRSGATTGGSFWSIAKPLKGGMNLISKLTGLMSTKATCLGTSVLLQRQRMHGTRDLLLPYKNESLNLRKRMRTYDLLSAGPRNRFTVLTTRGPIIVHNCTYNMGVPKFRATCEGYGFTPPQEMVEEYCAKNGMDPQEYEWEDLVNATYDDLAERAVYAWRAANPIIVQAWRDLEKAAKFCINNPGKIKTVGQIKFIYKKVAGFKALLAKLPSGHKLVYPKARIYEREDWGEEIQFWGILPQTGGKKWGWCSTYGGKLLENLTQAAAGDVMREGMKSAWAEGYRAFMLVHDELLTVQRDPSQTHERLCELLCKKQKWMTGLPLAAEGSTILFYKK